MLQKSEWYPSIKLVSAKVVFVGESNVGKSCLALRLAEDRYAELGATHGLRLWPMPPAKLCSDSAASVGEKRELVLWDLGGHEEYRLIHQLFLHDTTLALVLLDPTRGQAAFSEVEAWNKRLDKQLHGRKITKLLIATKRDQRRGIVDRQRVELLMERCAFHNFFDVSAKDGSGVDELRRAISDSLDWASLARTRRPELFQGIREAIEARRTRGEVVIFASDVQVEIEKIYPETSENTAVSAVIEQLGLQGVITEVRLATGDRALILRIDVVERYASSLILLARSNKTGVPAVEVSLIGSLKLPLPGIDTGERLPRSQERVVLESVVQLLLERGICLRHAGLLIFPALFAPTESGASGQIPHSVVLCYDFSGAIENVYSSLVAALATGTKFGRLRLWEDRAEFEHLSNGACGIRKVERGRGFAHLDVYFEEKTAQDTRNLFVSFIESHLREHGVDVIESLEVTCKCGFPFGEETVRKRLGSGKKNIVCPECESRTDISEGARGTRERDPDLMRRTWALRTEIEARKKKIVQASKQSLEQRSMRPIYDDYLWILHLSDFHMTKASNPEVMLQPLVADIRDRTSGLGIERLDYLVVSGDLSDRGAPEEFERASRLIGDIVKKFDLSAERCVIVPGNHDVDWETDVYRWKGRRPQDTRGLEPGTFIEQERSLGIRDEFGYALRFKNFSECLYHPFTQKPYPPAFEDQCVPFFFPDTGIQFIAFNSCWEIDEFFRKRASVYPVALARGLDLAQEQLGHAHQDGLFATGRPILRIAVWHHAITGNEKISDDAFLDHLMKAGVKLLLHGDVHEERADLFNYLDSNRQIHVIGAGAFGAAADHRPESTPKHYHLIRINRDLSEVRIYTRCKRREGGGWEGWPFYPGPEPHIRHTYYDITVVPMLT